MTYDLDYNARSVPSADVARSFVPPEPHFVRLLSRNHTLLLGPRGSGKTTLLKMLTLRALSSWTHPQAKAFASQITFNAAFIPADIAWGKQIDALDELSFRPGRKEAAFVLHSLRGLIHAMREAAELGRGTVPSHLEHLAVGLTSSQEEQFVKFVSKSLNISPALNTLLGMEIALQGQLDAINSGLNDESYTVDSFPSKITLIVSAFNGTIGQDDRRWALLFDELEIAPARVKTFLLSSIRSFDERIVVKLAIAPYLEDAGFQRTPTSPQPLHDYQTVQLSYSNKEDAAKFSSELFVGTFRRLGIEVTSLADIFEANKDSYGFGRRLGIGIKRNRLPPEFLSLSSKDESFKSYLDLKGLMSSRYVFSENNVAQDIRKVIPIVVARDYYLRKFEKGHVVANRSRKSHLLYTGYPSIVEVTEGNPRAILTLVGPLAQEHRIDEMRGSSPMRISSAAQSRAIRRVELLLTSLLQVVPLDIEGFAPRKGLLDFVDQIGRAFEDRLLRKAFSTDYVGTFFLDENVTSAVVGAVGKALNAGAFIHVPFPDSGPDALLRGLKGQRFRLSYALAARYRLLLTLGDRVSLSKIMFEMKGVRLSDSQPTLFDTGEQHDQH